MNFLAHLFLGYGETDLMIGNFIADFLRGSEIEKYSPSIQKGIKLHRAIDAYTDQHEAVKRSVERIKPRYKRYSPVIVDIYYDFFLGINWGTYSEKDLDSFAQEVYKTLMEHYEILPPSLQKNLPTMIGHNWLVQYSTLSGMDYVFNRMTSRTKFSNEIQFAGEELRLYFEELNSDFNDFFPDVIELCKPYFSHE